MRTFLFVDANNLAARCWHAQKQLISTRGERTGGVHGFLKGLSWCRHQTQVSLQDTVLVWDGGHAAGRKNIYPLYKKRPEPTPEDIEENKLYQQQLAWIRETMGYTECRQIQVDGTEADDLIAIFASLQARNGNRSIIYSGDGDMHQLHSRHINVFDPKKGLMTEEALTEKWGVPLRQIPLLRSLVGDSSDNISGVPKIGEKRGQIVCQHMGWEKKILNGRLSPSVSRRLDVPEKDEKWVQIAMAHAEGIVLRNLRLMVLPTSFEESFYEDWQAEEALRQWLAPRKRDRRKFIAQLERFELNSVLDNMTNW